MYNSCNPFMFWIAQIQNSNSKNKKRRTFDMCLAQPAHPPTPYPPNHFVSSCANYVSGAVNGVSNCPSLLHNQILTAEKEKSLQRSRCSCRTLRPRVFAEEDNEKKEKKERKRQKGGWWVFLSLWN